MRFVLRIFIFSFFTSSLIGCALGCKKSKQVLKVTTNQNKVLNALKKDRSEDQKLNKLLNKNTYLRTKEYGLFLSVDALVRSNQKVINAVR